MRNKVFVFILSTAVLLSAGVGILFQSAAARAPYFDRTYQEVRFDPPQPSRWVMDNGMIVHFLPDEALPVVTMSAIVHCGDAYSPAEKTGLGEIAGDVIVTGGTTTKTPDQVDEELEFLGIRWNGSVGTESGSFSMQTLTKDFDVALGLFADLLQHPGFDSAKFQLAIDNTKESIRRQNDSPRRIIGREFDKLIYGDHPYGRYTTEESLDAIALGDIRAFYERYFHPNAIILAVSGQLTEAGLREALAGAFGGWTSQAAPVPAIPPLGEPQKGYFQIQKDISQTNLRFGHLGLDRHNPDRHAVRVLNHILGGGGFTSRMMGTVRSDSGWAYSVGTSFTMATQPGEFIASCQTKSETTSKALALMQWVIADCLEKGVTEDELNTAKESILNSDVFQYVTPVGIVERYAWLEYFGYDPSELTAAVDAIRAVTKADVDAVARKYLKPENYTVLAVGPIDQFDAPLTTDQTIKTLTIE